jgi:hypothetical protein
MRKGTFGSVASCGNTPGPTRQALLIARSSRSRAFCTSWAISVVALLSGSQVTAPPFLGLRVPYGGYPQIGVTFSLIDDFQEMTFSEACQRSTLNGWQTASMSAVGQKPTCGLFIEMSA